MGLTVHYELKLKPCPDDVASARACWAVEDARRLAQQRRRKGSVDAVSPILADATALRRFGCQWLIVRMADQPSTFTGVEIHPLEGFLFTVNVGQDCEPLTLGLCRYPKNISHQGARVPTKLGGDWRFAGFSKTQYASLHGWEHFLRCHRAVVETLAEWRTLGVRVKLTDEGEYWPRRSVATLRRNVDNMNGLVAAMAGAIKDGDDGEGARVESPIFAHKDFERLEAAGEARAGAMIREARGEIARQVRKETPS